MKILLIHNPFQWTNPIYWFSFLIRVFTCSRYNHAALLIDGMVWESAAEGVVKTPYGEWAKKTSRIVKPLSVDLEKFGLTEAGLKAKLYYSDAYQYGYFDILPFLWKVIVQYRWLGRSLSWSGKALLEGYFCSEFVAWALGVPDAHLYSPEALQYIGGVTAGEEFATGNSILNVRK